MTEAELIAEARFWHNAASQAWPENERFFLKNALGIVSDLADALAERPDYKAIAAQNRDFAELVEAWSERVNCLQCGVRYKERACGPTHAVVTARIDAAKRILHGESAQPEAKSPYWLCPECNHASLRRRPCRNCGAAFMEPAQGEEPK